MTVDQTNRILLILFAASIAVGWICFDERLSRLGDNAEFIVISKGLATGHGMSFVHGPEPEPARKFPPGYPAILAVTQLFTTNNVNLMKSISVFFFALLIPLTWLVVREIDDELTAYIVAVASLLSPHLIEFSHQVLSEVPYAAVSMAGILYLIRWRSTTDIRSLAILVCLAVAAYYIRTIGLTVIGALVCTQFLDRRFKIGFLVGTAAAILILPWVLHSSAYLDQFSSVNPYKTDESPMISIGFLGERLLKNLDRYGFTFFPWAFAPFIDHRYPPTLLSVSVGLVVDLLLLYYLVVCLRRSRKDASIPVYLALYLIVVLLWPAVWADTRFVIPIIPLAIYGIVWSIRDLLGRLPIPAPYCKWVPLVIAISVLGANGVRSAMMQVDHKPYHAAWRNYFDSADWVRYNTPEDAIIVCRKPFLMHVMSGRTTLTYPWIEPTSLLKALDDAKADYVVADVLFGSTARVLIPAIQAHGSSFFPVQTYEESQTMVYEFLGFEDKKGKLAKLREKLRAFENLIDRDARDPANWQKLYALGTMFHQAGDFQTARSVYERVVPRMRTESNVMLNLGILHFSQSRFNEAIAAFTDAVNLAPRNPQLRLGLAQAYEQVGNHAKASEHAREAFKLSPKSRVALQTIARCAVELGNAEEAEMAYNHALKLEPQSITLRNDLALFYIKSERYEDAYGILNKLISDKPERTEFRLDMVTTLINLGRLDAARSYGIDLLRYHQHSLSGNLKSVADQVLGELATKLGVTRETLEAEATAN